MPFTKDMKNLLKRYRESIGYAEGTVKAIETAKNKGLQITKPRKKYERKFKVQKKNKDPLDYI